MKKEYISPVVFQTIIHAENLMTGSITGVGGDAGVGKAGDSETPPGEADGRKRNDFEDDELLDEELIQEASGWKGGLW